MNKSAIKNFAVTARVKLKEQIKQKAFTFGITKDETKPVEVFEDTFEVNGNKYSKRLLKHRESLVNKIKEEGFEQVIEEVAYTWFNRLIAIRFMEVNEYLPAGVRVLSSTDPNKVEPDVIREVLNIDLGLNQDLVFKLQDENKTEELFKYILIKQCNELGKIMPVVFEEIEDYTEILLPDNLLQEGSIIRDLVTYIKEDDWREQVEIIGWLYQYYISEKKDEVFEALKKNVKITKENIPAATQLFTPDWIVKYMVENSLGRLWLESHPDEELKSKWKYYLEEVEQEYEVQKQLDELKSPYLNPEEIKVLDPAMGSGHILVYAFDVLYEIYKSAGYSEKEIPTLILEKNIYGLDIDDRAGQLACLALMMKARSKNRRIFKNRLKLNLCSIQESNGVPKKAIDYLVNPKETEIEKNVHREEVEYLINVFHDAKEYGAILEVKEINFDALESRIEAIRNETPADIFEYQYREIILEKVVPLIDQGRIMSQSYKVVCSNPPYMGIKNMNSTLSKYLSINYPYSKYDLFATFIESCLRLTQYGYYCSMITQNSWMFLGSFYELRNKIYCTSILKNMTHLGYGTFGADFGTTTFVMQRVPNKIYNSLYIRLADYRHIDDKEKQYFSKSNRYICSYDMYEAIPDKPMTYWASKKVKEIFLTSTPLIELFEPKQGIITGNTKEFVRNWYEVNINKIGFKHENYSDIIIRGYKWFPFNKGGSFRKWYGNYDCVVNMESGGDAIRNSGKNNNYRLRESSYYFLPSANWNAITSTNKLSVRHCEGGFLFSDVEMAIFNLQKLNNIDLTIICSYLNSKVTDMILNLICPTLHFNQGDIARVPIILCEKYFSSIREITKKCISISRIDWDSFEASWDFNKHPILINKDNVNTVEGAFEKWSVFTKAQFDNLRQNEEELNRIFIEIYGLEDEISPEVEDRDVTINKADRERDIKSFISYSVGCMFGRYSLDEEGLIYAGGEFNSERYKTLKVDIDNVIPITDDEYFEDDIVNRFVGFIKITFGEETLEENLDYIADTLGKKGNETSRQTIRRYFLKDFYKDHVQTYQKRPIYWLFDSGKNDGFKALIYMHRYDIGTVAKVRTDYLHLLQRKYEAEVNRPDMVMENSIASAREKTEARKKKEKIQKQILECIQYDQVIAHVANQKISIDLDDGVNINYGKFQGVEVPQGESKKPLKADLLAKV